MAVACKSQQQLRVGWDHYVWCAKRTL